MENPLGDPYNSIHIWDLSACLLYTISLAGFPSTLTAMSNIFFSAIEKYLILLYTLLIFNVIF